MATSPEAIRTQLAVVTTAAAADLAASVAQTPIEAQAANALAVLPLLAPTYYDAAGSLAIAWYDELRDESDPATAYTPSIIGDPATDWIDREAARLLRELEQQPAPDLQADFQRTFDEIVALTEKEIARGFRDSILGNTRIDEDAVGWSRVARPGACKFCSMLADKGAVYRSESTAIFAGHKNCNCAAQPKFRNGQRGPEANVVQYEASARRARTQREQDARNARVRAYLNKNYPDSPG